jgi:protein-glutamine gamma-glutamyltransferase
VWLEDAGWTRIDPTAVVAPSRLEQGLRDLLPDSGSIAQRMLRSAAWLRNVRNAWDAASNWWQERVVSFNLATQLDLLSRLGLKDLDYGGMALLLLAGAVLWSALTWWLSSQRNPPPRPDALLQTWLRFIALLGRRGIAVAAHDGPRTIATRAAGRFPAAATEILRFSETYQHLRFGREHATLLRRRDEPLSALRRQLRQIARATATRRRPRTAPAAPE